MTRPADSEYISIIMEQFTRVFGVRTNRMDKESNIGLMEADMKGSLRMERNMGKEYTPGRTEASILELGPITT